MVGGTGLFYAIIDGKKPRARATTNARRDSGVKENAHGEGKNGKKAELSRQVELSPKEEPSKSKLFGPWPACE
jgi:hypothetical protein